MTTQAPTSLASPPPTSPPSASRRWSPGVRRAWGPRSIWPSAVLLALVAGLAVVVSVRGDHVDLDVYGRAGERWLAGDDPYAVRHELPFTYPPLAAVLAAGVALAPSVAILVLGLTTAGVAAWAMALAWTAKPGWAGRASVLAAGDRSESRAHRVTVVVAVAVASEPVLRGLHLGQANGLVVGLVLIDLLVLPDRWRGWLTGLAAGLKLTPLVFVMHLAARGDRAAVARLLGGFGLTVVVGAIALPRSVVPFWSSLVLDAHRVGDPGFVDNQSLLGATTRLLPDSSTRAWLLASAVVLGLASVTLWRRRSGPPVVGVVVSALAGLLVSPISWSHHWLLLPAAGALCWQHGRRLVGAVTVAVCVGSPFRSSISDVPVVRSSVWTEAASSCMTLAGIAVVVALVVTPPGPSTHPGAHAVADNDRENPLHEGGAASRVSRDWGWDQVATPSRFS